MRKPYKEVLKEQMRPIQREDNDDRLYPNPFPKSYGREPEPKVPAKSSEVKEQSIGIGYSYTVPQEVDKPSIEKSLEDEKEWEKTGREDKEEEVETEQAIGGFGPEHMKVHHEEDEHECPPGEKW